MAKQEEWQSKNEEVKLEQMGDSSSDETPRNSQKVQSIALMLANNKSMSSKVI